MGDLVAQLATKNDLAMLRQELNGAFAAFRQEVRAEIAAQRQEAKGDAAALRHEVALDIAGMRRDMERLELRMTVKLGTMMAGAVALTAALVRLL